MKFDKIIMNPPYCKNLHLKVLAEAIEHLSDDGNCVNLAPSVLLTTVRNNWSELAIKKYYAEHSFQHLVECEKIEDGRCIDVFNAGIQQHMGICKYDSHHHDNHPEDYAETFGLSKELIMKIMKKCQECSIKKNQGNGKYVLPLSGIHGHIGCDDFLNIMSLTYEDQLKSKGCMKLYFETEEDRHAFYDFWMSHLGKLVTMLWKVDTHVMDGFIPYFWCKNTKDFYKFFDITEDEQHLIEDTMEKYK